MHNHLSWKCQFLENNWVIDDTSYSRLVVESTFIVIMHIDNTDCKQNTKISTKN